jgi:UrcA family protein
MYAKLSLVAATCAGLFILVPIAHAGGVGRPVETGDQVSVAVNYADLKTDAAAGAKALLGRLKMAAREVCGTPPGLTELQRMAAYRACVQATVDSAVATIDNPVVTALNAPPARRTAVATAGR